MSESIVHTGLGRLMHAVSPVHPYLTVDVLVDASPRLRSGIVAGTLELALLLGPVVAAGKRDLPLGAFPLAWVARPGLTEETPSIGRLGPLADPDHCAQRGGVRRAVRTA